MKMRTLVTAETESQDWEMAPNEPETSEKHWDNMQMRQQSVEENGEAKEKLALSKGGISLRNIPEWFDCGRVVNRDSVECEVVPN